MVMSANGYPLLKVLICFTNNNTLIFNNVEPESISEGNGFFFLTSDKSRFTFGSNNILYIKTENE